MVRIVETEITSRLSQLFRGESLERGLGCNWHEHGKWYGAMGERQDRSTRLCGLLGKYTDDQHSSDGGGKVLMSRKTEWEKNGKTDGAFGYAFELEGWSI